MEISHDPLSEERKRELIAQDLRKDPGISGATPTTLYIRQSLSYDAYTEIQSRTTHDDLYRGGVTDENIDWFINTFVKNLPWRECFYKEERDKRG